MILIVDFGGQTAHLIGRRLRQMGIDVTYTDPTKVTASINKSRPRGIILSGGPDSVYQKGALSISKEIFSLNLPVLGICYGWQLMAHLLGGNVQGSSKEYGPETLRLKKTKSIFRLPKNELSVIVSHGDTVRKLPNGFQVVGSTKRVANTAVVNEDKKLFGVQFHPEADHTEYGRELLKNFVHDVCGETIKPLALNPKAIIQNIRQLVGTKKVICAVSGGVDSTVTA